MLFTRAYEKDPKPGFSKMAGQNSSHTVTTADIAKMGGGLVQFTALCGFCDYGCRLGHFIRPWDGRERPVREYRFETGTCASCSLLRIVW